MTSTMCNKYWRVPIVVLCQALLLQSAWGQQLGGQRSLRIVVVAGEGSRNVVQQIPSRQLIARVIDAENLPVAGATVIFTAPQVGPSGEFENDERTIRVTTGLDGLAAAGIYHPNAITGNYQISVSAEYQGANAIGLIAQTNVAEGGGRGKLIAVLAIVGAAVGAVVAFRNKDNSTETPNAPTITFGGSAVGAPK